MIFEARTKVKQMCANTGMLEWGLRSGNYRKGQKPKSGSNERLKRDVREVTKYVETALVLDKAMVSFRPVSSLRPSSDSIVAQRRNETTLTNECVCVCFLLS